mgnify:CR=1 FL=1
MRKNIVTGCMAAIFFFTASAQKDTKITGKLKVFIDCSSTWCDMNFIRSEINLVDFMLDRIAADVHVLVTNLSTGSGGSKYQLIFFGQNRFKNLQDTLHFNTDPNSTDFERRDMLIKYMKLGLTPFVAKTDAAKDVIISFKKTETATDKKDSTTKTAKDPWNYWVFRISTNGYISANKIIKSYQYNGNVSVNRITEELKMSISSWGTNNRTIYVFETDSTNEKFIARNNDYGIQHYLVKSINDHWSAGYEAIYSNSRSSNYKGQLYLRTAVEYDIFPYKDVNTRYFTFSYGIITRFNRYYDTTIYNKMKETLLAHSFEATLTLNKKWGTIYSGFSYSNFLHNWKLNNIGVNLGVNVRVTGGLSFNINLFGELVHDQVYLSRYGATEQEVLTRIRKLKSSYNFQTSFGIGYRFGSKLNNFVNPRFEGGNN